MRVVFLGNGNIFDEKSLERAKVNEADGNIPLQNVLGFGCNEMLKLNGQKNAVDVKKDRCPDNDQGGQDKDKLTFHPERFLTC